MEEKLLSINELCEYLGISRVKLWQLRQDNNFPKPINLGTQQKWKKSEIEAYIESTRK
jgi:excisionase family DNA binding protein